MKRNSTWGMLAVIGVVGVLGVVTVNALSRVAETWSSFGMRTRAVAGPVVLQQVQRLNRLETSRYNGQVIVRGETRGVLPVWLAGDKVLFVGRGEVVAGVDMAKLTPGDLQATGDRVTLKLPPAQILHTRLDNRTSEVHERQSGVFTGPDPDLETNVRIEAEDQIQEAAREHGILKTARENARETMQQHLTALGFREVTVL